MLSTPRREPITLSAVTGTNPPHGQHDPYSPAQPDPTGGWQQPPGFYLNQMAPPPQPRRWSGWLIALIALGSILTLGLGVGVITTLANSGSTPTAASSTPTPTADTDGMGQPAAPTTAAAPTALTVKLGETIVLTYGFGDDEVRFTLAEGKAISRTKYGTRPEKGAFFALSATVQVIKGSAYVYGGDYALVTKDGTVYEANMSHAVDGGLEGVEVRTGQKITGLVVWDIPAGVQVGAKVELRAGGPGGDQGFWQLP